MFIFVILTGVVKTVIQQFSRSIFTAIFFFLPLSYFYNTTNETKPVLSESLSLSPGVGHIRKPVTGEILFVKLQI